MPTFLVLSVGNPGLAVLPGNENFIQGTANPNNGRNR